MPILREAPPRMAGLGLFFHDVNNKSTLALVPRGLLQSAYDFLCLIYAKCPRASWNVPGQFRPTLGATRKKRFLGPQRGFGDAILYSYTKT